MATRNYRIRFAHEGREFEFEGDKPFVLEMLQRFGPPSGHVEQVSHKGTKGKEHERRSPLLAQSQGKTVSIREFIQQIDLKKHTDITVAFGYYLERVTGVSEFTPADINTCYYEAKLESSNTSQMIIQNIRRGYIMPSKKKGEKGKNRYTLTSSGEKFIETRLAQHS